MIMTNSLTFSYLLEILIKLYIHWLNIHLTAAITLNNNGTVLKTSCPLN